MAHTYTKEKVTKMGDQVTVVGSVDSIPVTVNFWASAVVNMTDTEKIQYVAQLMLAQAFPEEPQDLTSQYPNEVSL